MGLSSQPRVLTLKVVYCGPGLSGKTSNLRRLHERMDPRRRGRLVQLETAQERTLFFDWFPLDMGRVGGVRLRVHVFSVPGQSFYALTRRAVLQGADGVVFVADSARDREAANELALSDLFRQLDELGQLDTPLVFQWNKRDLPDALPLPVMERSLNPGGRPAVSACALAGEGVEETHRLLMREMLMRVRATSAAMSGAAK